MKARFFETAGIETKQATHRNAVGLALAAKGMLAQRNAKVINTLENVKVPSLVVVGEKDENFLAPAAYMANKIPGCEKVVVPKAGHAVNIDNPRGFLDATLPFLEKVDKAGRADIVEERTARL